MVESNGLESDNIEIDGNLSIEEYCEKFRPEQYLKEYYSSEDMWNTDMILAKESWTWLSNMQRTFQSGLDVGTGPVLEYPFMFAPYVSRYDLSDYVDSNLIAIDKWVHRHEQAHDWAPIFRGVLRAQDVPMDQLPNRSEQLRRVVGELRHVDLRQELPVGKAIKYDLVTSFFCTECVDTHPEGWARCKGRLLDLVAPGGAFFSAVVQNCSRYRVLGSWFPTCNLHPQDLERVLDSHEFDAEVESYPCPEFTDSGFSEFMIIKAVRR
jgi:hypothetical protein